MTLSKKFKIKSLYPKLIIVMNWMKRSRLNNNSKLSGLKKVKSSKK